METKVIGGNLKRARLASGFTQEQVSDYLGINRSAYSNYETGERAAPLSVLEGVAKLTGCSLSTFFETDPSKVKNDLVTAFRIDNLSNKDLHQIAKFKTIVRNYIKMQELRNEYANK